MKRPIVTLRRGYTLIELMIVVAIMGILAAIALPRYQNYQLKSKMAEPLSDLEAAKVAVSEAYGAGNNSFPATASPPISTTRPSNATYVSAVAYNSTASNAASVVLTLSGTNNPNVDGKLIGIFGTGEGDGTVSWICGTAQASTDTSAQAQTAMYPYIPVTCQN